MSDKKFQIKESTKDGIAIAVVGIGVLAAIGGVTYCIKGFYDLSEKRRIIKAEDKYVIEGKGAGTLSDIPKQQAKINKDLKMAAILAVVSFISFQIGKKLIK